MMASMMWVRISKLFISFIIEIVKDAKFIP